jgi:Surface antigen
MPTVEAVRRELKRHIGYRETGTNDTVFNREFGRIPGYPHDGYGYPWCHSFLSVCLKRAGLKPGEDFPWTASCLNGVDWFKKRGQFGKTPKPGAMVYYGPDGGTHVEWVERVTADSIVTIGGNTSGTLNGAYFNGDGVYSKTVARSSSRIYGYGYPVYKEDDGMPSAKEIAEEVYKRLTHTVAKGVWAEREGIFAEGHRIDPRSAFRQIWAYCKDAYQRLRELLSLSRQILAKLEAQDATIKALVEALAARDAAIDADALMARIRSEISSIQVRLVAYGGPPEDETS